MSVCSPAKVLAVAVLAAGLASGGVRAEAGTVNAVTFESLLNEMVDRDRAAKLPEPAYLCKQFSSYDRLSRTPADPKGWFANVDRGNFLRTETGAGRKEWVLMDHSGPGCIARFWAPDRRLNNGKEEATIRFYFDGASEPSFEAHYLDFLTGKAFVKSPFAYVSRRAGVLFLPIPFAKGCKITLDREPFYYIINYRAYEEGTDVETFSTDVFDKVRKTVESVGKTLLEAPDFSGGKAVMLKGSVAPGGSESITLPAGPAALRVLRMTLDPRENQALRSTVLRVDFDGEESVWCPVGDFFGNGVGHNPFKGWYRTVDKDGGMTCRWVMPYQMSAKITVVNLGRKVVTLTLAASVREWTWDERSMHFHGNWRQQYPLPTRPLKDWNYIEAEGRGVYVGDALAIMNPVAKWWGEGDEKIWVDGEDFPSHFGTGTEDYYGYAWGGRSNDFYTKPFHAQPRCGARTYGHNTQTRTRVLDAIPFTKSLKVDMEAWHWADCNVAYAAATYWYARPGATSNRGPEPKEAARDIPAPPTKSPAPERKRPKDRPLTIPGAIEFEDLQPSVTSDGVVLTLQPFARYRWSGGKQWLVRTRKVGDFVEFAVPATQPGKQKIILHGTKARDYGQFRISVNGQAVGKMFDFYSPEVVKTGPVDLGEYRPEKGKFVLRFEVVGSNPHTSGARTYAGLDCVVLTEP